MGCAETLLFGVAEITWPDVVGGAALGGVVLCDVDGPASRSGVAGFNEVRITLVALCAAAPLLKGATSTSLPVIILTEALLALVKVLSGDLQCGNKLITTT